MVRPIRLKIIHRNRLFRECLESVLAEDQRFDVQSVDHTDGVEMETLDQEECDVFLIDLNLPGELAVDLTQRIRRRLDGAKLLLLAYASSQQCLVECIAAGAHGCILETSSLEELEIAIEKVYHGETFCSQEIVQTMFDRLAQTAASAPWQCRAESVALTPREFEVVSLISDRLSNKEIARRLSLSVYTVKNHVHNIVEKLQVEDRHEAVEYARQQRWLKN
jgi:DNA-binding NarL/FixJ family response regulator